jgi:RNA polymerase sigma-70 factor (ECF subfamily)
MREHVTEARIRLIYAETLDALYAYASRRCGGDRSLAEDVTQETWLRAVREWQRSGVPKEPIAWLTVVARNLILNHHRRNSTVSLDSVTPAQLLAAVDDDRVSDSSEMASIVGQAISRLPKGQARLLEAFHFERIKVTQIARVFGLSERAVEGRLRRARERLRRELESVLKAQGGLA